MKPITIRQEDIQAYAEASSDFNPIHVDLEFAKTTSYGGTIAHGTISSALVVRHLTELLGPDIMVTRLNLKYVAPIRSGDRLECRSEPTGDGTYAVSTVNQDGATVAVGDARILRVQA